MQMQMLLLILSLLPSLSFSDDCPFPCLPPPPPPVTSSPPPPPPSPIYYSPPPLPFTPSYWNYPPPPYTAGAGTGTGTGTGSGGSSTTMYGYGTPPPPDPILPYFPWYYHSSPATAIAPFSLPISLLLALPSFGFVLQWL